MRRAWDVLAGAIGYLVLLAILWAFTLAMDALTSDWYLHL